MSKKYIILLDTRDGKRLPSKNNFGVVTDNSARVRFDLSKAGINLQSVKGLGIVSVEMPNAFWNITHRNNLLEYEIFDPSTLIVLFGGNIQLDPGFYNSTLLRNEIKTKLEVNVGTFDVDVDAKTNYLSVTCTTANQAFRFKRNESTVGNVFGWMDDTDGITVTGSRPLDLRGVTSLLIKTSGSKTVPNNILTTSTSNNETFLHVVNVDAPYSGTIFWKATSGVELFPTSGINLEGSFVVELMNRNKEPININNLDYRIGLMVSV